MISKKLKRLLIHFIESGGLTRPTPVQSFYFPFHDKVFKPSNERSYKLRFPTELTAEISKNRIDFLFI